MTRALTQHHRLKPEEGGLASYSHHTCSTHSTLAGTVVYAIVVTIQMHKVQHPNDLRRITR